MDPQEAPNLDYIMTRLQSLEDLITNHKHTGYDRTPRLNGTAISQVRIINDSSMGDGVAVSGTLTMRLAAGQGDVFIRAGIDAGDFANTGAKTGFIMGIDDSDSDRVKFYFGSAAAHISYDGTTFSSVGVFTVSSLDIPDVTTANSFHVDSSGNMWLGSNVASGLANANASITSAGSAVFKNILVGGTSIQYQIGNGGIFSFGDGSDGAGVADGSTALAGATLAGSIYTLTRDVYYTTLTISTGVTIKPSGYRVFGTGTLTMNGTASFQRNGTNGTAGGNGGNAANFTTPGTAGALGAGGAALPDGYLKGALAGADGGAGGVGGTLNGGNGGNGSSGVATINSIGSGSVAGGAGGSAGNAGGSAGTNGSAGPSATATASTVRLIANWHLATLLDISTTGSTVKFDNSASAGAGGGGAGGGGTTLVGARGASGGGGGGGGSGSPGGIIAVYFRNIVIGASATFTANGGNGGKGGDAGTGVAESGASGGAGGSGGGGGGAGGNGGQILLVYNTLTNSGTLTTSAGTFGAGGAKSNGVGATLNNGVAGSAGTAGTAGTVRQFQMSL